MRYDPTPLGWFTYCIKADPLPQTQSFYQSLGFSVVGGQPEHGYAVLASGTTELTAMNFLRDNLINLRGGDVIALVAELGRRGLEPFHLSGMDPSDTQAERKPGARKFDPSAWPPEFTRDTQGNSLPSDSSGDFLLEDPDGHLVYFDSVPVERARFEQGDRFASEQTTGSAPTDGPDLGRMILQLRVSDLDKSQDFYGRLGLRVSAQSPDMDYVEMTNDLSVPFSIGLTTRRAHDVVSFVCPDVDAVARHLAAGSVPLAEQPHTKPNGTRSASLRDPQGNMVMFHQPPEQES